MSTIDFATTVTPLGTMLLAARGDALCGAWFEGQRHRPTPDARWRRRRAAPVLARAIAELDEYFRGARRRFDLRLAPEGTPFQRAVWDAIAAVPYGATTTYAALAASAGRPRSVRAAGAATGRNPLSIFVPCHRIVGARGALTGYAGGLGRKRALLDLEHPGAVAPARRAA